LEIALRDFQSEPRCARCFLPDLNGNWKQPFYEAK
jgi:hypothetical protein